MLQELKSLKSFALDFKLTLPCITFVDNADNLRSFYRNLRGEKQGPLIKKRPTQLPLPPQYRLRHRLSSPVLTYQRKLSPPGTPDKDLRLRSSSTSQVPSTRMALPSRVPPLSVNRVLTPELRSVPTPEIARESIPVTPEVVDLGTYTNSLFILT